MRGADQQSLIEQESSGRPVEPPSGVRTDVVEGGDDIAAPQQQHGLARTIDRRGDFERATVGNITERTQTFAFR